MSDVPALQKALKRSSTMSLEPENSQQELWHGLAKRPRETCTELPTSLKKGRMDCEVPLAAEVVCRSRPREVAININVVAALVPDARAKWLSCALENATRGVARPSDIWDIVSHRRFAIAVSQSLAQRMMGELRSQAAIFPDRLKCAIHEGDFCLGRLGTATDDTKEYSIATVPAAVCDMADAMMARCVEFVRSNEESIAKAHELEARTFHVELRRNSQQEVWGLTWSRAAFEERQRVLEAIVPDTPAGRWNEGQRGSCERTLQPGDVLIAVNGNGEWEAMASIRELVEVRLRFERGRAHGKSSGETDNTSEKNPPSFAQGGYKLDAASGWWGHATGQWLFNDAENVYFHVATKRLLLETAPSVFELVSDTVGVDRKRASAATLPLARQRGRLRWFSRAKGFGFVAPWHAAARGCNPEGSKDEEDEQGLGPVENDVFVHRGQLENIQMESEAAAPISLLPGVPLTYSLAVQEGGKLCAADVRLETDLASLCSVGTAAGSNGRYAEKAAVELMADRGRPAIGAFAGVLAGFRGVACADFVALRLAQDLASCLQGREQGGEKGARPALLAACRQTQHRFLQNAQHLSSNSAKAWLSAEAAACLALVFGPDVEGRPCLIVAVVGSGRALVCRRDGTVAARLGGSRQSEEDAGSDSDSDCRRPLGRGITEGRVTAGSRTAAGRSSRMFGARAWCEKDGSAAGLAPVVYSHGLDWEQDAFVVLGSSVVWQAFPDDEVASRFVCESLCEPVTDPPAHAAQQLLEAVAVEIRGSMDNASVAVLRLDWCPILGESRGGNMGVAVTRDAHLTVLVGGSGLEQAVASTDTVAPCPRPQGVSADDEDIFAAPPSPSAPQDVAVCGNGLDSEDMFAAPPTPQACTGSLVAGRCAADLLAATFGQVSPTSTASSLRPLQHPTRPARPLQDYVDVFARGKAISSEEAIDSGDTVKETFGPVDMMDSMFADFCKEVGGLGPGT